MYLRTGPINEQKSMSRPVLHSLNACRVMAEFVVVSYHVGNTDHTNKLVEGHGVSTDLMSFFFVLSGFAAAYSRGESEPGRSFFSRRMRKTYPLYLASWLADFPGGTYNNFVNERLTCDVEFWAYSASQLLCIQSWLAWGIGGINYPSWYIGTLVWIWAAFSLCDFRCLVVSWPLTKAALLYATSLGACLLLVQFDSDNTKQLAPIRLLEFYMGCAVESSVRTGSTRVNGWVATLACLLYAVNACLSVELGSDWNPRAMNKTATCDFWQRTDAINIRPGKLVTVTSAIWAVVIHWLASSELHGLRGRVPEALQWDVFKSLSSFSLQVYLTHAVTWRLLASAATGLGVFSWLAKDWAIIVCYAAAYATHLHLQPRLDRMAGVVRSAVCSPPCHDLPEQELVAGV